MKIVLLLLLVSPAVYAQAQVDCGSSTLFKGTGCGVALYTPTNIYYGGIAYSQGHAQISASDTFEWHDNKVILGSRQVGYSFDGTGLGISLLGASIEHKTDDVGMTLFAGATGQAFSSPFVLAAVRPNAIGLGAFLHRKWKGATLYNLDVWNHGYTAAVGIDYKWQDKFRLSGSGGVLNSQPYLSGAVAWRPETDWNVYANHQSIFSPYKAIGNSIGAYWNHNRFSAQASVNESNSRGQIVTGETIGAGVRVSFVTANVNWYESNGHKLTSENLTETFGWHHISATENISQNNGRSSYAFGGNFQIQNRLSVGVNHSIVFLLNGEGFQQVTGVNVSVRVHDATLNFQNVTTPLGQNLYSVYGTDYIQTGNMIGGHVRSASLGGIEYTGRVVDETGEPVEGAAVQIGKIIAYSNSQGYFSIRSKKSKPVEILVLPAVFAAPGEWEVVSAPESITPTSGASKGDTVSKPSAIGSGTSTIVVRRK